MNLYPSGSRVRTALWSARRPACLRAYPMNSPKAMARVLAVTLLSDGLLESRELENLARANGYARLGMTQGEFMQVLFDFCEDLLTRAPRSSDGDCKLEPELMGQLLAEVSDPWRRRELVRLMIEVIRADGKVSRGESVMFWEALDAWDMTLSDVVAAPRGVDSTPGDAERGIGAQPTRHAGIGASIRGTDRGQGHRPS